VIILTPAGDWGHSHRKLHAISWIRVIPKHAGVAIGDSWHEISIIIIISIIHLEIIDCNAIIDCMASITIRNLDESTKRKLKIRGAMNGRSMEQEAREILKSILARTAKKDTNLAERIRAIFAPLGGVELERIQRVAIPDPDWTGERE
jgi:plasmid stability protein